MANIQRQCCHVVAVCFIAILILALLCLSLWNWKLAVKDMSTAQNVFVVFYAIFWGTQANVQGRWKMFNWPLIVRHSRIRNRCLLSLAMMNLGQVLMFVVYFWLLDNRDYPLLGIMAAFGIFGWYRFWLAIIEWWPERFYFPFDDLTALPPTEVEPRFRRQSDCGKELPSCKQKCLVLGDWGRGNFLTGIVYLAISAGPLVVVWVSS